MKWNTTATEPPFDKPIIVVHNVYLAGKTELRTTTGTLKCADDLKWVILRRGDVTAAWISIGDIHGWCLESSFANDAFYKIYQEPVETVCPHCGKKTIVIANAYHTNYLEMPVVIDTLTERLVLDWNEIDAECDFEYGV
jgi:hypothetical protein